MDVRHPDLVERLRDYDVTVHLAFVVEERSVESGTLRGEATPIHRGRSQQLWQVFIRSEDDRLVAEGQVRLQNLPAGVIEAD